MRKSVLTLIVLVALVWAAAAEHRSNTNTPVGGKVRIFAPISLVNTSSQPLDFGVIAKGANNSVIVVAAAETPAVNVTGDAVILTSHPQTAAWFTVSGEPNQAFIISMPTGTETISDGVHPDLVLSSFTCSKLINDRIIGAGGSTEFYVGATLTLPNTAGAGEYSGTFNVTVAYQ